MIGTRGWGLGVRLITIFFLIFAFLYPIPYTLYPSSATESTPSSEIRMKLEELKREIASKAAKLKQEVNRKLTNKAYAGNLKTISSSSLTLASTTGPKMVSINQDTVFESKVKGSLREARKKFSQKALTEEDYIAALGDIDETKVLTAKKIILLNPTPYTLNPKIYLWGKIVSIDGKLTTLLGQNQKNIAASLPISANVKSGDFIIATGAKNKNNIFEAEFVHVIQPSTPR